MSITCEKCGEWCKSLYYYNRHKNKKFPCVPEEREKLDIENRMCLHCKHVFSTHYILVNHLPNCKLKPTETEELKQIILNLSTKLIANSDLSNQQMKELAEKNTQLETKIDNLKIVNNTINVQNNIIVTPFGKEDLSFLTLNDYSNIFRKGCYSISELVKLIHCNDNKPEYTNVYIKNFKDAYMFTFDGKAWDIEKKDDILNNMIESKKYFLENTFNNMQSSLPEYSIKMFKKFLERKDNDEVICNIKDELKNMFYKNRNFVTNTTKKPRKKICNNDTLCITDELITIDDNDYICETNLFVPSKAKKVFNKVNIVKNDISKEDNDYICETNLFVPSKAKKVFNKVNIVKNDISKEDNDYICETNLFISPNKIKMHSIKNK
jgi:hypothetical protein